MHSSRPERLRAANFAWLRFLAALAVVAGHYMPKTAGGSGASWLEEHDSGAMAVTLFFTLSGLTLSQARPVVVEGTPVHALRFLWRRALKLLPLYWGSLALTAVGACLLGHLDLSELLVSAAALQAWLPGFAMTLNKPAWFMSALFAFYALCPLLAVLGGRTTPTRFLVGSFLFWLFTTASVVAVRAAYGPETGTALHDLLLYSPLAHASTFVFAYSAGSFASNCSSRMGHTVSSNMMWSLALAAVFVILQVSRDRISAVVGLEIHYASGFLTPLFIVQLLLMGLWSGSWTRFLRLRPVQFLGEISFTIYMLQHPLYAAFARLGAGWLDSRTVGGFAAFALALCVISALVQRWIMAPLVRRLWASGAGPMPSGSS